MTTTSALIRREQQITSVRLASNINIAGSYSNGLSNNGVEATLTVTGSSLTIDGITCQVGDRVLLAAQTSAYQNGIYVVQLIDTFNQVVILERADDFQFFNQMKPGYYVSVSAGNILNGAFFVLVEPAAGNVGVDPINFLNTTPSEFYTAISISSSQFTGMYATPLLLVPAPGANKLLVLKEAVMVMKYGTITYTGGGLTQIQYTNLVNGTGYSATLQFTNTSFQQGSSIVLNMPCDFPSATGYEWTLAQIGNQGLYLSNQTGAFATGNGTFLLHLWYSIVMTA